jgi:hypothetical protein
MKMDIEGFEYVVLSDLIVTGSLCESVNGVFGEQHFQFFPTTYENGLTLESGESARTYLSNLLQAISTNFDCKTVFSMGDDESYLHDGIPWPTSNRSAD